MMAENPYYGLYNPRKKSRKRSRNPKLIGSAKNFTRGVTPQQFLAVTGNLVFTAWAPAKLVKTVASTQDKLLRVGAAILTAVVGAGVVGVVIKDPRVAQAAALGGFASAGVQALAVFNVAQVGSRSRSLPTPDRGRVQPPGGGTVGRGSVGANPAIPTAARMR